MPRRSYIFRDGEICEVPYISKFDKGDQVKPWLTKREVIVLLALGQGKEGAAIAEVMGRSLSSTMISIKNLRLKFNKENITQVYFAAIEMKLITRDPDVNIPDLMKTIEGDKPLKFYIEPTPAGKFLRRRHIAHPVKGIFTEEEIKIARALKEHGTLTKAYRALGIPRPEARNTLDNIFRKTNTSSGPHLLKIMQKMGVEF